MLKGIIDITGDVNFVNSAPLEVKVITMDETGIIDPNRPNVIIGTCLLPPIESLIAEADNDKDLYMMHYINHLSNEYTTEFIVAIIAALFRGTSILIFMPQINDTMSFVTEGFILAMNHMYGIDIGIIGLKHCSYNLNMMHVWLGMLYMRNLISPKEYMYWYPNNGIIFKNLEDKLIIQLGIPGSSKEEKLKNMHHYMESIKKNPNVETALVTVERM